MSLKNPLLDSISTINKSGRVALCGYLLTGFPTPELFHQNIKNIGQLDIFEFGIPSNNPFLDGDFISKAHYKVSQQLGIDTKSALSLIHELQPSFQPRFVMSYSKEGRELDGFIQHCQKSHIHGVLVPDIQIQEARRVSQICAEHGIAFIGFVHANMTQEDITEMTLLSDIVYLKVSPGVTGEAGKFDTKHLAKINTHIQLIKQISPYVLITAGIGIREACHVEALSQLDINMIIVGTSMMEEILKGEAALKRYIHSLKSATLKPKRYSAPA